MRLAVVLGFLLVSAALRLLMAASGGTGGFIAPEPEPPPPEEGQAEVVELAAAPHGGWSGAGVGDNRAFHHDGKVFVGYLSGDGDPEASEFVDGVGSTPAMLYAHSPFEVDDHDNPAILRRASDGRLVAAWSLHVGGAYRNISTNPDDATSWQGNLNITSQIGALGAIDGYTYAHLHQLANEDIHLFFRFHADEDDVRVPYLMRSVSTDDGVTWGARELIAHVTYRKIAQTGDRLDFALSDHPEHGEHDIEENRTSIWHMYYEGGNWYQTDGTEITEGLPFELEDTTQVYDAEAADTHAWVYDVAMGADDKPRIVYATFPGNDGEEHEYWYARWTGTEWENHLIAAGGTHIATEPATPGSGDYVERFYSGGVCLDHADPNRVWASVQVGSAWEMFEYVTDDDGETWTSTQLTESEPGVKHVRPASVVGRAEDGIAVVWMAGRFDSYTDYDTATWGATIVP